MVLCAKSAQHVSKNSALHMNVQCTHMMGCYPEQFLAGLREEFWQYIPEGWIMDDVTVSQEH